VFAEFSSTEEAVVVIEALNSVEFDNGRAPRSRVQVHNSEVNRRRRLEETVRGGARRTAVVVRSYVPSSPDAADIHPRDGQDCVPQLARLRIVATVVCLVRNARHDAHRDCATRTLPSACGVLSVLYVYNWRRLGQPVPGILTPF
jgi:hypothetical protein